MIDLDEIRKDAVIKYGVLISKDDPALVSVSMLDSILEQHVATLNAQHQANVKVLVKAVTDGRVAADGIVKQGGAYVSDQAHTAVTAAMEDGREEIRKDLRLAWAKIESSRKAATTWAAVSGFCALIAVLAAVLPLEGI